MAKLTPTQQAQIAAFDGYEKYEIANMVFPSQTCRFRKFVNECDRAEFIKFALRVWNVGSVKSGLIQMGLKMPGGSHDSFYESRTGETRLNIWLELAEEAVQFPSCEL